MPDTTQRRTAAAVSADASTPAEHAAFLSYSHLDRGFAVELREALRAGGASAWLDESEIRGGTRWSDELQRAIRGADAFVFLLSPHSAASRECGQELDHALSLNKRILPVRVAETPLETLPPHLAEYQFIPSRTLFGEDFAGSVRQLITEIETDRDWVREHTDWSEKASEWVARGRNRSYLLSGAELRSAEQWRSRAVGKRPGLSALQSEFFDASRASATRRLRRTRAAVSVALVVAVGLAALAFVLRQQAVSAGHSARSGQLASNSLLTLSTDPQLSLKLAVAAADVKRTSDALDALRAAIPQNHMLRELSADQRPLIDAQWSADGSMVVTTSEDDHVRIYSTSTGRVLRTFALSGLEGGESGGAYFLDRDRELLAWNQGAVHIWNVATGRPVLSIAGDPFGALLTDVVVNPQATIIAGAAGPGEGASLVLWSARTGRLLHVLLHPSEQGADVVPGQVAFSPNGRLLAAGSQAGIATVWNVQTGGFVRQLNLSDAKQGQVVATVAFSPDGRRLATARSIGDGGRTLLWNVADWTNTGTVNGIEPAWNPTGSLLTTTAAEGAVLVWNPASPKRALANATTLQAPDTVPAAFGQGSGSQSGDIVIPSLSGQAKLWNPYTGNVDESLAGDSGLVQVAGFANGGSRILTWSSDGSARIWDAGRVVGVTAPHAAVAGTSGASLQSDQPGDLLGPVRAYNAPRPGDTDALTVFDVASGRTLVTLPRSSAVDTASFDDAGDVMLLTRTDLKSRDYLLPAQLRRTHGGALLHTLPGVDGRATTGVVSPNGRLAATVSSRGEIAVWDVASGRRLVVFDRNRIVNSYLSPRTASIWLAFSPDSSLLLSSDADGRSFVWRPTTGRVVGEFKREPEPASGMFIGDSGAISPDDRLVVLASSWEDGADVYRVGSSTPIISLVGGASGIADVAFAPDSQLITTLDGTLQQVSVYDTQNQQPLLSVSAEADDQVGFTADGQSLITDGAFPYQTYPCSICGDFDQLLVAAHQREIGGLTAQERALYLR